MRITGELLFLLPSNRAGNLESAEVIGLLDWGKLKRFLTSKSQAETRVQPRIHVCTLPPNTCMHEN